MRLKPDKVLRDRPSILPAPIIGHRYWVRRGTRLERALIRSLQEEYCGFCGEKQSVGTRWTRYLVEIVPLNRPLTFCCKTPDEPPPGSFAVRVISGSAEHNGGERWLTPAWMPLLSPV